MLLAAALLASGSPALTGGDLADACARPDNETSWSWCVAYIAGICDLLGEAVPAHPFDYQAAVRRYLAAHPERHNEPASSLVVSALTGKPS